MLCMCSLMQHSFSRGFRLHKMLVRSRTAACKHYISTAVHFCRHPVLKLNSWTWGAPVLPTCHGLCSQIPAVWSSGVWWPLPSVAEGWGTAQGSEAWFRGCRHMNGSGQDLPSCWADKEREKGKWGCRWMFTPRELIVCHSSSRHF